MPLHQAVQVFMQTAGQSVDGMNGRQGSLYIGLMLEEIGETIEAVQAGAISEVQRMHYQPLINMLKTYASEFRAGLHQGDVMRAEQEPLIDGLFDSAWVAIGALYSIARHPLGAIAHGAFTNLDKFESNDRGSFTALKDENGKVKKRPGWRTPDFSDYVDTAPRD